LMNRGCTLIFKDNKCVVSLNGVQLFIAALKSKLFAVNTVTNYSAMIMTADDNYNMKSGALSLWHRRMGHANEKLLKSMIAQNAVTGMNTLMPNDTSVCEGCVMGKHTHEPFKQVETRASEVLQLVHTDVGEADMISWSGKRYYVTFIDDYSRCVWVYVIEKKSDVCDVFIKWKTLVENQTQHTIKAIRSDRGGE